MALREDDDGGGELTVFGFVGDNGRSNLSRFV